jgi:hypothetical protein
MDIVSGLRIPPDAAHPESSSTKPIVTDATAATHIARAFIVFLPLTDGISITVQAGALTERSDAGGFLHRRSHWTQDVVDRNWIIAIELHHLFAIRTTSYDLEPSVDDRLYGLASDGLRGLHHGDTREDPDTEVNIAGPAFRKLTGESKNRAEIAIGRRLAAPAEVMRGAWNAHDNCSATQRAITERVYRRKPKIVRPLR